MSTESLCVCAAALERARREYGHLEGQLVQVNRPYDRSGTYPGVLNISTRRPGYLFIDRGDDGDRSFGIHIDEVTECWAVDDDHATA